MSLNMEQISVKRKNIVLLVVGIMLFASTLRVPLTSIGSLVPIIRDTLGVSSTIMGLVSTLPLLAFAFISPFVLAVWEWKELFSYQCLYSRSE